MNKRSELSLPVLLSAVTDTVLQTLPRPTETRCSQRPRLPHAISVAKASRRERNYLGSIFGHCSLFLTLLRLSINRCSLSRSQRAWSAGVL
jgi:hypothetical protein